MIVNNSDLCTALCSYCSRCTSLRTHTQLFQILVLLSTRTVTEELAHTKQSQICVQLSGHTSPVVLGLRTAYCCLHVLFLMYLSPLNNPRSSSLYSQMLQLILNHDYRKLVSTKLILHTIEIDNMSITNVYNMYDQINYNVYINNLPSTLKVQTESNKLNTS